MQHPNITFIGVGHMATAMINGLISNGFPAENITATNKTLDKLNHLNNAVTKSTDNNAAIEQADVVVLAVKPQVLQATLESLTIKNAPLFISIAAGTPLKSLTAWLGGDHPIVRCMPNMPAEINQSATGAFANTNVSAEQHKLVETILNAIGATIWLNDESHLATVIAIAGSAPGYYFYFLDILQNFAIQNGLSAEQAKLLVAQACAGSGALALQSNKSFAQLKQSIMSPSGTTEAALNSMESQGFAELMQNALEAANNRSNELSNLNIK